MSEVQGPTIIFDAEIRGITDMARKLGKMPAALKPMVPAVRDLAKAFDDVNRAQQRLIDNAKKKLLPVYELPSEVLARLAKEVAHAEEEAAKLRRPFEEIAKAAKEAQDMSPLVKSIHRAADVVERRLKVQFKGLNEAARRFTEHLKDIEELEEAGEAAEALLATFGRLGDAGSDSLMMIADPAKRLELALVLAESAASNLGSLSVRLGDLYYEMTARVQAWAAAHPLAAAVIRSAVEAVGIDFSSLGEVISAMTEAVRRRLDALVKAAIAAASAIAAGVVGGLTAAFALALEGNKKLKKSFDELERSGKKLVSAAAQIFIGLAGIDTAATDATKSLDGMTTALIKNQGEFRIYAALVIELASDVGQFIANMGMVIRIALFDIPRLAYRVLQALVDRLPEMFHNLRASILTSMAGIILDMALMAKKLGADDLAKKLRDVWEGTRDAAIQAEQDAKQYGKGVTSTFTVIKGELDELVETLETIDSFGERGRTLAQKIRLGNVGDIKVDTTGLDEKEKKERKRKRKSPFAVQIVTNVDDRVMAFAKMNEAMGLSEIHAANFTKEMIRMDLSSKLIKERMDDLGHSVGQGLAGGFLNLADAVGTAMGAFAAGTGTLSAFGDSILDLFGDLASSIGDFYLKTGLGMMFIPGGQATGAGLIAAGLGLKVLGGFLGGKGSGNRGSGRGTSSGGGASVDPSRFLRPERSMEPAVTNLKVVILGEEIEKPVTRFMDDVARRGGFRNLATRT